MREVREVHASPLQLSSSQQSSSQQSLLALEQDLSEFETSFEHEHHKLSASQIQTDAAEMRALVTEHRKHMQVM